MTTQLARVSFLGVGKMGEAFLSGLLKSGYDPDLIKVYDTNVDRMAEVVNGYQVKDAKEPREAATWGKFLILAVKPKDVRDALSPINDLNERKIIISFVAGTSSSYIARYVPKLTTVLRSMPNLSCRVGQGIIGVARSTRLEDVEYQEALELLRRTGLVYEVEEELLDLLTGYTGSGPAYVCAFIEALTNAGTIMGLSLELSSDMALQLVRGTSSLLIEGGLSPEELRRMVTTPGGTTAKGLEALDKGGFRGCIIEAIKSATQRAKEIHREIDLKGDS